MFKKKNQNQEQFSRQRPPAAQRREGASVFSYYASRSARAGSGSRQEETPAMEGRRKKQLRARKRWLYVTLTGIAVTLLLYNSFLGSTPRVIPVSTVQNSVFLRGQQIYEQAARRALTKRVLNGNKMTIDKAQIAYDLQAQFPELARVTVTAPYVGRRVQVYIEPTTPQLLLSSHAELYVVDTNGRALIMAKQVPHIEKLGLPAVVDESGLSVQPGKPALPSTSVAFITEVVGQLKAKNIGVSSVTLPAGTSELDVKVSGAPYTVKFNLRGDARAEAGAYLAVKQKLEAEHTVPTTYIDVRVEDRAYYK